MLPGAGQSFGRYTVVRQLGRGGMGVVFAAIHRDLQRDVALKLLTPELSVDEAYRNRFLREAQVLARLDSPNVVRVHDAGEQDGWLFIATELIPDGDLDDLMGGRRGLPVAMALELVAQVADALAVVHEQGILHRDIKPSNVLVRRLADGRVRAVVCDFGIAALDEADHTRTVGVIGTPTYMSPERHDGADASVASDVYALGCLLWALLTGDPPYVGTPSQIILGHLQAPVPQLPATSPVHRAVNDLLARMMAKAPEDRFATAAACSGEVRRASALVVDAGAVAPTTAPTAVRPPPPRPPSQPPPPPAPAHAPAPAPRSRRWPLVLTAAALALAAVVTAAVLVVGRDDTGGGGDATSLADAACDRKLAFVGPTTGEFVAYGAPALNGVKLALTEYNDRAPCRVELEQVDTRAEGELAAPAVAPILKDETVVGVVGPMFNDESLAAGPSFFKAGLPTISPSVANPELSTHGWDTFHRGIGSDVADGLGAARYIENTLEAKRVFLVTSDSTWALGLTTTLRDALESVVGTDAVGLDERLGKTVRRVLQRKPDAVYFAGYSTTAARLVKELRDAGYDGHFVIPDGAYDATFRQVGDAAEGTIITCTCATSNAKGVEDFTSVYVAEFGEQPGSHAVEAYAAARVFLDGLGQRIDSRADMLEFVNTYDEPGIIGQVKFDITGELEQASVYAYELEFGQKRPLGKIG